MIWAIVYDANGLLCGCFLVADVHTVLASSCTLKPLSRRSRQGYEQLLIRLHHCCKCPCGVCNVLCIELTQPPLSRPEPCTQAVPKTLRSSVILRSVILNVTLSRVRQGLLRPMQLKLRTTKHWNKELEYDRARWSRYYDEVDKTVLRRVRPLSGGLIW